MTDGTGWSGRLVGLREIRADDVDALLGVVGDDRVTRMLSFDSRTRPRVEAMVAAIIDLAAARPRTEYQVAVTARDDDELIGFVRLGLSGVRAAKLGYAIRADQWGCGYATDACAAMLELAFRELDLHRVTAAIGPDNAASISVVRRLGFAVEGRLRDHVFTNGGWRDSLLYSILADQWAAAGVSAAP